MGIELKGNLKEALGFKDIVLSDDLTITLSELKPVWVKKFVELIMSTKERSTEDFVKYFTDFFKENSSLSEDDIGMLVSMYITKLVEEFTIAFRMVDRDTLETKKAEEMKKHSPNTNL